MLHANTKTTAFRAALAGVSRVHELDADTGSVSLIGDELLKLHPGPAGQPKSKALAGADRSRMFVSSSMVIVPQLFLPPRYSQACYSSWPCCSAMYRATVSRRTSRAAPR
jgi:hypothetical protein